MPRLRRLTNPFRLAMRKPAKAPAPVGYWSYTTRLLFGPRDEDGERGRVRRVRRPPR